MICQRYHNDHARVCGETDGWMWGRPSAGLHHRAHLRRGGGGGASMGVKGLAGRETPPRRDLLTGGNARARTRIRLILCVLCG